MIKLYYSLLYSIAGIRAALMREQSLRLEIYTCLILIPLALYLPINSLLKLLLVILLLQLLICELFNSAIEALVNRISLEIHPQSKFIKDVGSAAVGIMIVSNLIAWIYVFGQLIYK